MIDWPIRNRYLTAQTVTTRLGQGEFVPDIAFIVLDFAIIAMMGVYAAEFGARSAKIAAASGEHHVPIDSTR
jgi:hypothetical protein